LAELSVVDYQKAMDASTIKLKPTRINFTNLTKQISRDEMLYRQDDRWSNVVLDNTREEREADIQKRTKSNRSFPIVHKPSK
jgi:hypothetical protein